VRAGARIVPRYALVIPSKPLTCWQARRLWNLDQLVCESLLTALVDVRFLVERDGVYLQRASAL